MSTRIPRDWQVAAMDRDAALRLAKALNIPPLIAHILQVRGISTPEEGAAFLDPTQVEMQNPFLLQGISIAVDRLTTARDNNEHVLIFGDYDVDGIVGTAILFNAFQRFGIHHCSYGMPNRLQEGYGLSPDRVLWAQEQGANLIVTVDNGIAAHEAAATARQLGIDLIITDHHMLDGPIPDSALAVINPKCDGEGCLSINACGAAVAFKLAYALTGEPCDLDLVALGTVADVTVLLGENRQLVSLGLEAIAQHPRIGLIELARVAKLDLNHITAPNIAFQLAPRINAAGRLGDGLVGLQLLLTHSKTEAAQLAQKLNAANEERRNIEETIFQTATEMLEKGDALRRRSIVLAHKGWHAGVIGIVASRLQSKYCRPTVLIALEEEALCRGSARSTDAFNIGEALATCSQHLVQFGGHNAAAGFVIQPNQIDEFAEAFEREALKRMPSEDIRGTMEIDAQVSLSEIDARLITSFEALHPFGQGNPSPVFCAYKVEVLPNSVRELNGGHVRFVVRQNATVLTAIGFRMEDLVPRLMQTDTIDLAFTPQFNTWRGETTIQLVVKDIKYVDHKSGE